MTWRRLSGLALPAVLAVLTGTAAPSAAELYRWTDRDGTVHYTTELETIPAAQRASAVAIGSPTPGPVAPAAPSASAGAVMSFAPGAPMIVDAFLNGVAVRLIVDTGADRTVVSEAALARAGVEPAGPQARVLGVTGSAMARIVTVPRLDVAGARLGPLSVVAHTIPAGADGLLGRDVLDAFTLTVDAARNRATLVPR